METKKSHKPLSIVLIVLIALACAAGGTIAYRNHQVEQMRSEGVANLESSVDMDAYREKQQKKIDKLVDEYTQQMMTAEDQETIDQYTEEFAEKIDSIKTDAELTAKEKAAAEKKRKEEEAKRKAAEEKARKEAEEAAAAAAAAAAQSSSSGSSGGSKNSGGCVGNDASNFY